MQNVIFQTASLPFLSAMSDMSAILSLFPASGAIYWGVPTSVDVNMSPLFLSVCFPRFSPHEVSCTGAPRWLRFFKSLTTESAHVCNASDWDCNRATYFGQLDLRANSSKYDQIRKCSRQSDSGIKHLKWSAKLMWNLFRLKQILKHAVHSNFDTK